MKIGPVTQEQMNRFGAQWKQGEHVLITGPTGGGKTNLARHVVEQRIRRGGHVIVLVAKPREDKTIADEYSARDGWTRWKTWHKTKKSYENKILLWPDTSKYVGKGLLAHQKDVFQEAFDKLGKIGLYTVQVDEGLYTTSPTFLNMGDDLAMLHAMGRSSHLSLVTNAQRPAHLPLIVYTSAASVFAGRMREAADTKRLAELGGKQSAKELMERISRQGRHDFTWIPVASDGEPEPVNLAK